MSERRGGRHEKNTVDKNWEYVEAALQNPLLVNMLQGWKKTDLPHDYSNPSKSLLRFLCAKFSISEEWMLEGIGTPLPEWDMTTDKGVIAKYNALRVSFEKMLLGATGDDLVSMVQAFCYFVGALDTRKIDQQETTTYRKALCSVVNELEKLTTMVSSDAVLPSKTDAMGWVDFKNSCSAATNRINQSVKDAVNVYLEKYGEEMKL